MWVQSIFSINFISIILRVSTPLIFVSMGAIVARKAGILCIAFEGIMLVAALTAVLGSHYFSNPWVGLITGMLGGILVGLVFAYFVLGLKANNVLTGLALNILASGGTIFMLFVLTGDKGTSRSLTSKPLPIIHLPFIKDIPVLGQILSGQHILTYVALFSVVFVHLLINKTALGLRIRSVGENPDAAESLGISVNKIKIQALVIGSLIAAIGGVYMSMGYLPFFTRDMISGRGFMGIAAQNLGGAGALPTLIAVIFFGATEAISNVLQSLNMPSELLQSLPYIATIIGLVFVGHKEMKKNKKEVR